MRILIGNQQQQTKVTRRIEEILEQLASHVGSSFDLSPKTEVSLTFVDDEAIRELNCTYRNVDSPTDVLSFAFDETAEDEPIYLSNSDTLLLGEIVISMERAVSQAEEFGHNLEREVGYLAVHGMLHLLGYDHQDEEHARSMRAQEEKFLALVGLTRE